MSVTDVKELFDERRAVRTSSGRRYTRVYHVHTDSMEDDDESVALAAPSIAYPAYAQLYLAHPKDGAAFCVEIGPAVPDSGNPFLWRVPVRWETPFGRGESFNVRMPRPLERDYEIDWSQTIIQVPFEREAKEQDPKAVLNSAGEKFDPPILIDEVIPVLRITRNENGFDPLIAYQYASTVNEDVFFNAHIGTALMRSIIGQQIWEDEYIYWRVSYEIQFRWYGWSPPILDLGFSEVKDNKLLVMLDETGLPYNVAQLLNGGGLRNLEGADPVYLPFQRYRTKVFGDLKLVPPRRGKPHGGIST